MTRVPPMRFYRAALFLTVFVVLPATVSCAQTLSGAIDRAMAGRSGGAVVLSVESGKVLASYRPRIVAQRMAAPGSAIKPFVLLELLRSGRVSADTEWSCRRRVQVAAHNLDCQHVGTVEAMNAERALAYSCNSYFTEMGARLDAGELEAALRKAGFGAQNYLIADAALGRVAPAPNRTMLQLEAVGESGIKTTPLEMAAAYRWLALQRNSEGKMPSPLPAGSQRYHTVLAGLRGAVQYGTAQGAQVDGLEVAGKTGTASAEEGAWTHAWFAGFAPAAKPEIVIVVFLERGHGSEAAEIAGKVLKAWARERR